MKIINGERKLLQFDICDLSLAIYLCVLLAHQQENTIELLLRYGSLAFVVFAHMVQNYQTRGFEINLPKFSLWLIALLAYGLLSCLWSITPAKALSVLKNLLKVSVVCFVLIPRIRTLQDIERILRILLLALCYMILLLVIRTPLFEWGTARLGAAINQHSNAVGRYANLGLLLCLYFFTTQKKGKPVYLVLMGVFAAAALLTGSKNAVFIMVFQVGSYCYIISDNRRRVLTIIFGVWAVIALSWMIMNIPWLYQLLGQRIERMLAIFGPNGREVDGSTRERMFFIREAWRVFTKHPITGVGMNNFAAHLEAIGYQNPKYSHCGFVELLSTLGICGFALYYGMYFRTIRLFLKFKLRKNKVLAVLFVHTVCIFIFDISTISMYEYMNYITLLVAVCSVNISLKNFEIT